MTLSAGTKIGSYEIVDALGAGGMGEVYRARDTKLRREVAIKILPEIFASDADRVARFQREAELLAALNHPNIAAVYGIEESGGASAIVMELVDGDTLEDRLRLPSAIGHQPSGGLPIDDALSIARQIVDALEAAHERGVVHRDLKPANIKITPDGKVKVLDFGLAKFTAAGAGEAGGAGRAGVAGGMTMSPTLSVHATYAGIILGTAAYMSPEQARGKPVDRRTDIWAFGCVLFEMLTGKQAFEGGETVSDAVAAILRSDVDWTALPPGAPPHIIKLLRRCLQKDPQKRLPHIGVARLEIEEGALEATPTAAPAALAGRRDPIWRRAVPIAAIAVAVGALAAIAAWTMKPAARSIVTRFAIVLPEGQHFTNGGRIVVAMPPDGTRFVYVANQRLYLRTMGETEARPISGSDTTGGLVSPVFSPDGQSIVYYSGTDQTLKRISITGGTPVTICDGLSVPFGVAWSGDDVFAGKGPGGIIRVASAGGKPETVVKVDVGDLAYGPQLLPDGDTILFTLAKLGTGLEGWDKADIVAQSLKTGARTTLVRGGSDARYLPTGHIIYAVGGVVFAVPFDLAHMRVPGPAVPIIEGVRRSVPTPVMQLSVSTTGSIVYLPGPVTLVGQLDLALFDRKGAIQMLKLPPSAYGSPRISPDGRQLAVDSEDSKEAIVWVYDLAGTSALRRLTMGGQNRDPVWSADGQRVIFQSNRDGDLAIFWQRADGTGVAERLTKPEDGASHVPESVSPDGKYLLFQIAKGTDVTVWTYSFGDRKTARFDDVKSSGSLTPIFSPDGRWVAYSSNVQRALRVYVQPFPATGAAYEVGAGFHPFWSPDGKELFYIGTRGASGPGQMGHVTVATGSGFSFGKLSFVPRPVGDVGPGTERPLDALPDGRFVGIIQANSGQVTATETLNVVLNWFDDLKQRVPVK